MLLLQRISALEGKVREQDRLIEEVKAAQKAASKGQVLEPLSINVPADLKCKIVEGRYVDLSLLLEKLLLEIKEDPKFCFVQDDQGRFIPKEKKSKVPLSIEQWTAAFHVFMSVYLAYHDSQLQQMLSYMAFIRRAAKSNPGDAWAQYDLEFRSRKEADPARTWDGIDNQLWLQLFCKAQILVENAPKSNPPPKSSAQNKTTELNNCYFFNRRPGCNRAKCQYVHRCSICHTSGHAAPRCPISPGYNTVNTYTQPRKDETHASAGKKQSFRFGGYPKPALNRRI